ncbi:MAG: fused MFS/spermidine synthase [Bryobacteraceae bacterium]
MFLFACAIFLSSFLLFLIQPIFAKLILPWFGGSSAVWITCLVFFQVALLIGYVYAHFLSARLRARTQAWLHIGLLALAILFLPVIPGPAWTPASGEDPTWRILGLLTVVLGLPYVLLSSTGPLLQSWYARRWPESQPYRLFALSNVAALLALCAYPIWIEPRMATRAQDVVWSIGFAGFAVLAAWSAWVSRDPANAAETLPAPRIGFAQRAIWIALAAGGSMLLLSTTNQLTQNVAPVPLLWILPLAIYLLTFILCFESTRWYRRELFLRLLAVALASVGYAIYDIQESTPILVALPVFAVGLFLCCMYCHGELSRLKPQGTHLTSFYLMVALGGALGAVFVGLIAPLVFSAIYELPVSLLAVAILAAYLNWNGGWAQRILWIAVTVAMALVLTSEVRGYRKDATVMMRNFYGGLRVVQSSMSGRDVRTLYHGTIEHGAEFMSPARRMAPTSYYGPSSGAGLTLRYAVKGPKRVGIIGLGAGTLSAYGQPGDDFQFYEINPQVIELANSQFFYLRDSPARVHVTLGDARLSLEREPAQGFDVLVVDAFSGDAIPVHLLTKEAFELYFKHLKPMGVLTIHVSNQYLDLAPVVQTLASFFDEPAVLIHSDKDEKQLISAASWVLITKNRDFFTLPEIADVSEPIPPHPALRLWTDDYNNLLQVIRW